MDRVVVVPVGPRLTRRTTLALPVGVGLGVASGVVVVAGCEDGSDGTGGPVPTATPEQDPDAALVTRVLGELSAAQRHASSAGAAGLVALHRAHIAALDGTTVGTAVRRPVPVGDLQRRERRLQRHLVEAAMAAEGGALAGLLASMSAAVSQRLAGERG